MSRKAIALTGGLNLSPNRFDVAEGQMIECLNFDITKDGSVAGIRGYRAYSGGCLFDTSFSLSCTVGCTGADVAWGFGNITTVGGDTFTDAGHAVVLLNFNAGPGGIIGGVVGRLPLSGERIEGATGSIDNYALYAIANNANAAATPVYQAHRMVTWDVAKGPNVHNTFEGATLFTGDSAQADQIYCTSQIGYPPGCFYWKDRLYVVCDIPSFAFGSGGTTELTAGSTVYLYTVGSEDGPFTVERVILEEGSWAGSDASGDLWLVGLIQESVIRVQDQAGSTPIEVRSAAGGGGTLYCTINSHLEPAAALLVKESGPYTFSPTASWERVDLGYEVRFAAGQNAFVVVNRLATDARLSTPSATAFTLPGTATSSHWSSPNSIKLDDATNASAQMGTSAVDNPISATNFGFSIPTYSIITGIEVEIERLRTGAGTATMRDHTIELVGAVTSSGNRARSTIWPGSATVATYGSSTDLWDVSLSPALVNDAAFGVRIRAQNSVGGTIPNVAEIDYVKVKVHYKPYEATVYFYDPASTTFTLSSLAYAGTPPIASATTSVAHGYVSGQTVTVSGATETAYNINAVITVTGATTFTYPLLATPSATPATGSPVCNLRDVATGTIVWYYKEKGEWDQSNDAEGVATVYSITNPTYVKAGLRIYSGANATGTYYADTAGAADAVYLQSSAQCQAERSQYEFEIGNFYGSTQFEQVFGVSGAGPAFSYDGKYAIRIRTGVENNIEKPRHVAKHGYQLALGYAHGDVAFSDVGAPESFAAVTGGASPVSEDPDFIGGAVVTSLADPVYAMVSIAEQSLAVFCRTSVTRISGSAGTFTTQVVRADSGVVEYTVKDLGGLLLYTDFRGIGILQPSDIFGQLLPRYVSAAVSPWLTPRLQQSGNSYITLSGPIRAETLKSKNQYRLYFRDRYVLTMTLVGQDFIPQFSLQQWNHDVRSSCSGVHSNGNDVAFFTTSGVLVSSTNGSNYVYQSEVGTTFNGTYIPKRALFFLGPMDSWDREKRYERVDLHLGAFGYANLGVRAVIDHARSGRFQSATCVAAVAGSATAPLVTPDSTADGSILEQPQNYKSSVSVNARGFALSLHVEQFGGGDGWDYATGATVTDHKYLMPITLNEATVYFESESTIRAGR